MICGTSKKYIKFFDYSVPHFGGIYMYDNERQQIVDFGKEMITEHLTSGTSGNISIFDPEKKLMLISPSGMPYFDTKPSDIVVVDMDGNVVEGERKPSSEWNLHLAMYKTKPEARAAVHTHSMYCTVLACLHEPIKASHYVVADSGAVEVPCAEYRTYGTHELAEVTSKAMGNSNAVLLANHGMIAVGKDLKSAFGLARGMEWCAEVHYRAMCAGKPYILPKDEMERVIEKFKGYGQTPTKK